MLCFNLSCDGKYLPSVEGIKLTSSGWSLFRRRSLGSMSKKSFLNYDRLLLSLLRQTDNIAYRHRGLMTIGGSPSKTQIFLLVES